MKKKKLNFFCTCNRSESVYYGKFISLLFLNKNFITTYQPNQLFLCVVLRPLSMKYKLEMNRYRFEKGSVLDVPLPTHTHTHSHNLCFWAFKGTQLGAIRE